MDNTNHVLKQVLNCIPTEFVPKANDDWDTQLFIRKLSRALINLRLYELKLALHRHNDGVKFRKGKSETPSWSSVITQARLVLEWHAKQLQSHLDIDGRNDENETKLASIEDFTLHITLINYLVNLQLVNLCKCS